MNTISQPVALTGLVGRLALPVQTEDGRTTVSSVLLPKGLTIADVARHLEGNQRQVIDHAQGAVPDTLDTSPPVLRPGKESAAVSLAYLLAKFQKELANCTDQQLSDQLDLFKQQSAETRKSQQKQAEDIQKREEAAARASDAMGCAGKILGGVIVGLSLVSAAFTGGASLAVAGVGLALLAADTITEAATGKSLTDRIISPLISAVFSPVVNAIGGVISDVLTKIGVDKDIADMVGTAVGAVLAIAIVVAAAVVAKSSQVGKLAGKLAQPLMRAVGKVVPNFVKQGLSQVGRMGAKAGSKLVAGADKVSNGLSRGATRLGAKAGVVVNPQVLALRAQFAAAGAGLVHGGIQSGGSAWIGINEKQVQEAMAEIVELLTSMTQMGRFLDTATDTWKRQHAALASSQQVASDAVAADQATSAFILRNARRVAA